MFKELLPSSIAGDEKIKAFAEAFEKQFKKLYAFLEIPCILPRIDELPEEVLDLLAWQFHVDFWRPDLSLEAKRELIKNSIEWHKHKGTPWAVKKALEWFGIEAEIIEYWQARKKYEKLGGVRLDGSWSLDGTKKLISYYNVTGLSYMSKWAEFCVRLNLASMEFLDWSKLVKKIVNIAKNARSWPVYVYYLGVKIQNTPLQAYSLFLKKQIDQLYPWCTKRLDGSWSLGAGGELYSLDGSLKIDGSWKVGGKTPVYAEVSLKQCNIFCNAYISKKIPVEKEWFDLKLGSKRLRLDGGWKLGKNPILILSDKKITKTFPIDARAFHKTTIRQKAEIDYPASPEKLGRYPGLDGRRIDGKWKVGREMFGKKIDGAWKVRSKKGIITKSDLKLNLFVDLGFPVKLGSKRLRLDGGWKLGKNPILILSDKKITKTFPIDARAFHKTTIRQKAEIDYPASPEKLGRYPGLDGRRIDGDWKVGCEIFNRKLDGLWKIRSRKGIGAQSELQLNIHASAGLPTKLGAYPKLGDGWSYKLNGSWQLGAFKKIDGTWSLDGQAVLGARKVGWHYAKLDGAWKIGDVSRKIDGTWVIGHNGPSLEFRFARRMA